MKISLEKRNKISEQILAFLFSVSPKSVFTVEVARDLARDEEFIKKLLTTLNKKGLVVEIRKNPEGVPYLRRSRWCLSERAYEAYKAKQT